MKYKNPETGEVYDDMDNEKCKRPCVWCWFARQRRDICGTYCTSGFENPDGTCEHYLDYLEEKKRRKGLKTYENRV